MLTTCQSILRRGSRAVHRISRSFCTEKPKPAIPPEWRNFGIAAAGLLAASMYYQHEKEKRTKQSQTEVQHAGRPALGGPFVLVDQDGKGVSDASYLGQWVLLYFGFTYCPDICPSELVKVGKVIKELEKRKLAPIKPLFVSVDPVRDSIGQLKHYAQDFHPSITYLTGTKEQVAAACRAYRVYFSKVDESDEVEDDYLVDHSIVLYLINPEGEFVEFFPQRVLVSDIADGIEKFQKEYKKKAKK